MTIVMKFGGTSVGSAAAMRRTAGLVARGIARLGPVVVVVSALGTQPTKVTDLLLQGAEAAAAGDKHTFKGCLTTLRRVHHATIADLRLPTPLRQALLVENSHLLAEYERLCHAGALTPSLLDQIAGLGERMSAPLAAAYLRERGLPAQAVDATNLIVTDELFQAANPLPESTRAKTAATLLPLLDDGVIPVVTGFIGATTAGQPTTLGRGGSDFTAAILGQALDAAAVWIWTDVDGVMTADPRVVAEARPIPTLTYREVAELARAGARVLHPRTIEPCLTARIPLWVKNSFNPGAPGTLIMDDRPRRKGRIKAVTVSENWQLVAPAHQSDVLPLLTGRTAPGLVVVADEGSGEPAVQIALPPGSAPSGPGRPLAIVTLVGDGLGEVTALSSRLRRQLGEWHVPVVGLVQRTSSCSLSIAVDAGAGATAVACLHDWLFGEGVTSFANGTHSATLPTGRPVPATGD